MLKLFIPVIIVLVLAGGGFYLYQASRSKSVTQETTYEKLTTSPPTSPLASPQVSPATDGPCEVLTKGSVDLPTLYAGVQWQIPTIGEYDVPLGEEGSRKMGGCLINSQKIQSDLSLKTVDYYDTNLAKLGWIALVSASGPNGSTDSYRKGKEYFLVREILQANSTDMLVELFYVK